MVVKHINVVKVATVVTVSGWSAQFSGVGGATETLCPGWASLSMKISELTAGLCSGHLGFFIGPTHVRDHDHDIGCALVLAAAAAVDV
jgi:hypothetical protein